MSLFSQIEVQSYVDKTKVGINERLQLTLEISGKDANKVGQPHLPEIKNFRELVSSSSSSSSIQIINGKMESQVTKSYTYTLQPQNKGRFLIPPLNIKYKGKSFTTDPISVNVIQGSTEPPPRTSNNFRNNQNNSKSNTSNDLKDNLFIKAEISKSKVFKGEPIALEYKLYTRYDVADLDFASDPVYNGFWKEDISRPTQIKFSRKNLNGVIFNEMSLGKLALFPTQSGKLVIPSLEMNVHIRTQSRSFFDFGQSKQYTIKSKKRTIDVSDLPSVNKPAVFSGAVGNFKISSSVNITELKAGDSFTYTLDISGTGNLTHFDAPSLPEIPKLRFIDPEISVNLNKNKVSGNKTVKYLVIAQEKGSFTIPAVEFSFFDTKQKKYVTKKTKSYTLNVLEGTNVYVAGTAAQTMVESEGADIGFIIKSEEMRNVEYIHNNILYRLVWLLLIISIPISFLISKEQSKLSGNADYLRQKQAEKILKKYMKQATEAAKLHKPEFYTSAQTGLSNYLSDKLKIPRGSTTEDVLDKLKLFDILPDFEMQISIFLKKCIEVRFMPGGSSSNSIKQDFDELKEIIAKLSKTKRRKNK